MSWKSLGKEGRGFSELGPRSGATARTPCAPPPRAPSPSRPSPPRALLGAPAAATSDRGACQPCRRESETETKVREKGPRENRGARDSDVSGDTASALLPSTLRGAAPSVGFAPGNLQKAQRCVAPADSPGEAPQARGPSPGNLHPVPYETPLPFSVRVSPGPPWTVTQTRGSNHTWTDASCNLRPEPPTRGPLTSASSPLCGTIGGTKLAFTQLGARCLINPPSHHYEAGRGQNRRVGTCLVSCMSHEQSGV